jgi:uncharacterized membrane protein
MSTFGPDQSPPPAISNKQLALIVYILYFVAYFTGITALIGVIIAHVQVASADPLLATHYRFQIRTFWIGILYLVIGTILTVVIVGIAILLWWFVWSLVRNVKGTLALNDNKPIANPARGCSARVIHGGRPGPAHFLCRLVGVIRAAKERALVSECDPSLSADLLFRHRICRLVGGCGRFSCSPLRAAGLCRSTLPRAFLV